MLKIGIVRRERIVPSVTSPALRNRTFSPIPKKERSLTTKIGPVDRVVPVTKEPDALVVGPGCDSCRLAERNFGRLSHDSVGRDFRDLAVAEFGENQRVTMTAVQFPLGLPGVG